MLVLGTSGRNRVQFLRNPQHHLKNPPPQEEKHTMRKFIASLTTVLTLVGGFTLGAAETAVSKPLSYRQQVVAGTYSYGACKTMRKVKAGRIAYWDMVADNTDDGKRRSVKAQVSYVRQGCRNSV
jgi:hypothetical protein